MSSSPKYGFLPPKKDERDFIRGDLKLGGLVPDDVLQPNSDWTQYIPDRELQKKQTETWNCTSFGTLNAIEMLHKRKFGVEVNWSDRALGILAGTRPPGNDPKTVAETLRKQGTLIESALPFTDDLTSPEKYYSPSPLPDMVIKAAAIWGYEIKYEWVTPTKANLIEALKHSPLGVAVYAWEQDDRGFHVKTGPPNHWTVLYAYDKASDGWAVFDSYANNLKLLAPDYEFTYVMRYWLERAEKKTLESAFSRLLEAVKNFFMKRERIELFCEAIQIMEGWYPGSRSQRNNSPGNVKFSPVGYSAIYGEVKKDPQNFAIFPSYALGWLYLKNWLKGIMKGTNSSWNQRAKDRFNFNHAGYLTIGEFFKIYAPAEDQNHPEAYAKFVADYLGLPVTTPIKDILL